MSKSIVFLPPIVVTALYLAVPVLAWILLRPASAADLPAIAGIEMLWWTMLLSIWSGALFLLCTSNQVRIAPRLRQAASLVFIAPNITAAFHVFFVTGLAHGDGMLTDLALGVFPALTWFLQLACVFLASWAFLRAERILEPDRHHGPLATFAALFVLIIGVWFLRKRMVALGKRVQLEAVTRTH